MLLDNFTIIAQLINFIILIWLLKRFLYSPILAAIDAREQRLQQQLEQAQQEQNTARDQQQRLTHMQTQFQQQQQQLLQETRNQAEQERKALILQSRKEIANLREQWHQQLLTEQHDIVTQLQKNTEQAMLQTVDAILQEITSSDLQQAMLNTFIERLNSLNEKQLDLLRGPVSEQRSGHTITTATPINPAQKKCLEAALTEMIDVQEINYEVDATLLCGIELHHNGHKLSWSVAGHLEHLQRNLATLNNQIRGPA